MNFEMAAELCPAGRRGVGTTVLAEKICGAAAERGYSLTQVEALCRKVNGNGRSLGVALTPCTVPAAGKPTFELGENEIEMGIGIHGEPGRERVPPMPAGELTGRMVASLVADLPFRRDDRVIAMVNGMGGTPLMELYLLYGELERVLRGLGIPIERRLVGNYITSLELAGCSITLLKADDELVSLWDEPVLTPGLRWGM
jgi:dihydroxyacetone kinase-like protein